MILMDFGHFGLFITTYTQVDAHYLDCRLKIRDPPTGGVVVFV